MIVYNHENCNKKVIRKPYTVSITSKRCVITFSSNLAELLNLKPGDAVSFFQSESRPKDWYIKKDPYGFKLRKASNSLTLMAFNAKLVMAMTKSFGQTVGSTYVMNVSSEPEIEGEFEGMYALIAGTLKVKKL